MRQEIEILKSNIHTVLNSNLSDIKNYILVPFDDPGFGPPLILQTADRLMELMNIIEVSGGNDCPENSIPAIEQAISVSKPNSFIFVFTNGFAKDSSKLSSIRQLCQSKNTQVIIFLSAKCVPVGRDAIGSIDTYFDVAKACSGSVLQFELGNFRQVFKIMRELIKTDWTEVTAHREFIGTKLFTFTVDKSTKDFMIAVSGDYPTVKITDVSGQSVPIENIAITRDSQVIRLHKPAFGDYKANILCQGPTMTTFYRRRELQFQYGFSPKRPKSMRETSALPIPGATSFICISIAEITIELNSVHVSFDGKNTKAINVEIIDDRKGLYAAQEFFEPGKSFKITIYGRDSSFYQVIKGTTGTLRPQKEVLAPMRMKPKILMIEPEVALVEYNSNFTVACKVSGYPKPTITWQDQEGTTLQSEDALLETPYVFISYAYIERVSKNSTIYCKCEYRDDEDSLTMDLFVNRTFNFDVIKHPENSTFEYGAEGQLYCEVDAYPEASIKWYHNDTLVDDSDYLEVLPDENKIVIKNMTLDTTGDYRCEISNSVEEKTFTAIVDIDIDPPEVFLNYSELVLKPGDWVNIECIVTKGKPVPVASWKFMTENGFEEIPDGVSAEDRFLKIPSIKTEHMGVYKCEASNVAGSDSKDIEIKVEYAPKIKIYDELKEVKQSEQVQLYCEVDAIPKARVRWVMTQGDVIVPLSNRHKTDEWNTHRFIALSSDSGNYHCIAENTVGKAERTIILNVLVEPYIEPPPVKMMTLRTGDTVTLPCIINYGNPIPSTKWEFIASNSSVTTISRGKSTSNLILKNLSRRHEGSYICVAENTAGSDSINIIVKVI
ncbi:unnamed protein product, partial [Iphiclides podalirius]